MAMHKKYTIWQRFILALREIPGSKCYVNCPGCGSSNTNGGGSGPYSCNNCGSIWQ